MRRWRLQCAKQNWLKLRVEKYGVRSEWCLSIEREELYRKTRADKERVWSSKSGETLAITGTLISATWNHVSVLDWVQQSSYNRISLPKEVEYWLLPIAVPRLAMWRTAAAQVSTLLTPFGTWRGNTSVSRDACLDEDSFEIIMRWLTKIIQGSSSWVWTFKMKMFRSFEIYGCCSDTCPNVRKYENCACGTGMKAATFL